MLVHAIAAICYIYGTTNAKCFFLRLAIHLTIHFRLFAIKWQNNLSQAYILLHGLIWPHGMNISWSTKLNIYHFIHRAMLCVQMSLFTRRSRVDRERL